MKNIVFSALVVLVFVACQSKGKKTGNPELANVATDFVHNTESLTHVSDPIGSFSAGAFIAAVESYSLDKDNAKLMLAKVESFESTVIVVEDHTIVLVVKGGECQQSASWGACMPYVRGYIKKGELIQQEDFANNIIGRPDNQKRTIYFFND